MICFADPLEGRFQILFEFVFQFLHVPSIKTRCCTENAVHLELTKKLITQSVIHDDELIPACKVRIVDKNNGTVDMFNGVAGIDVKLKGPDFFGQGFAKFPVLDFFCFIQFAQVHLFRMLHIANDQRQVFLGLFFKDVPFLIDQSDITEGIEPHGSHQDIIKGFCRIR